MRKIGAFIWYQKLYFNGWIQTWSGHTPLSGCLFFYYDKIHEKTLSIDSCYVICYDVVSFALENHVCNLIKEIKIECQSIERMQHIRPWCLCFFIVMMTSSVIPFEIVAWLIKERSIRTTTESTEGHPTFPALIVNLFHACHAWR